MVAKCKSPCNFYFIFLLQVARFGKRLVHLLFEKDYIINIAIQLKIGKLRHYLPTHLLEKDYLKSITTLFSWCDNVYIELRNKKLVKKIKPSKTKNDKKKIKEKTTRTKSCILI